MSKAGLALLAVLVLPGVAPVQDDLASAEKDFRTAISNQLA